MIAKNILKGLKGEGSSNKQLHIKLIRAENLKSMDKNGTSDPYVEFTLGGVSRTSKKKEKTLNPVWDEEIPTFVNFMENDNLGITIFDSNVIEKAKFMGKATIPLRTLPKGYTLTKRLKLQNINKNCYIVIELQAVNFGTNARLFEVNQYLKSYIRAFHSEADPLKNAIILRQTGQIYTDLAKCVRDLKKIEASNNTDRRIHNIDPLIIVFPGQYLIRRPLEIDIDNLVIYGISSREEDIVFTPPLDATNKSPMLRFLQPGDKIYRDKMIFDYIKKQNLNLTEGTKEWEDMMHNVRENASIKLFDQNTVNAFEKNFHLHNIKFAEGAFAMQIYRNCIVTGNNVEFTKNKEQARGGQLIQNLNFEFDELELEEEDEDEDSREIVQE